MYFLLITSHFMILQQIWEMVYQKKDEGSSPDVERRRLWEVCSCVWCHFWQQVTWGWCHSHICSVWCHSQPRQIGLWCQLEQNRCCGRGHFWPQFVLVWNFAIEFFKSQQYFKEQEGGWSYFYHNSRTDMHGTSGLGNQKIWKLSLDIASHRELYWYQLYFIDTSQDVKSQYVYTTFTIKWKGPVPFTQQVKVRRGKLVLALPSIRFLWNFYQIIPGTKYEWKTSFGPIPCHSWQNNYKKRPFSMEFWPIFDIFL